MNGGFLKAAIGLSLAVHAVGFLAFAYVPWPQRARMTAVPDQPAALTIVSAPEKAATPRPKLVAALPVAEPTPLVPEPKPEISAITPPAAEPLPIPPRTVKIEITVQPEPAKPVPPEPVPVPAASPARPAASVAETVPTSSPRAIPAAPGEAAPAVSANERIIARAQPNYRKNSEKIYPVAAIRRREEGLVIVTAVIDVAGRPQTVTLKQSSGHDLLDAAALKTVRAWEFEPARMDGRPVPSQVEVPVNFRLSD